MLKMTPRPPTRASRVFFRHALDMQVVLVSYPPETSGTRHLLKCGDRPYCDFEIPVLLLVQYNVCTNRGRPLLLEERHRGHKKRAGTFPARLCSYVDWI